MDRDSKKIITREWVENELRFYNTADIKYLSVNLITLGLALGVPTYFCLLLTWSCFDSLWAKLLMSGPLAFLVLFIVFSILWQLIGKLRERRALKKGNFDVVLRTVQYKTEKGAYRRVRRRGRRRLQLVEYLVFDQFGAVEVDHDEYYRTNAGDEFYMAVYYLPKPKVRLRYSARSYQYKE